jgi:hypothetical protein
MVLQVLSGRVRASRVRTLVLGSPEHKNGYTTDTGREQDGAIFIQILVAAGRP